MRWPFPSAGALLAVAVAVAQEAPAPPPLPPSSEDYVIRVEDVLRVLVWGENLDLSLQVRPDGKITVPLINDVRVENLTPEQARKEIATRLSAFITDPHVTVNVAQVHPFRIYVLGEVNQQGVLTFFKAPRLLHALASARGLTQFAKKEVTILRTSGGTEERIRVDYKRLLAGDPSQRNLTLQDEDTILVE